MVQINEGKLPKSIVSDVELGLVWDWERFSEINAILLNIKFIDSILLDPFIRLDRQE